MTYDPVNRGRRSIRLKGYDYSQSGAYFITICTHRRELLLRDKAPQRGVLSAWHDLPVRFPSVAIDAFVIMPNHVHGIVVFGDTATSGGAASSATTLGLVMRAFKSVSAIAANKALGRSRQPFWQRNYYEHVIRNDGELDAVRTYIQENPLKWSEDPDNPANLHNL